jgi:hypothetical protein
MLNIFEPMLYVGIGGTGLTVGRELEGRLRDAICGPTGRDFIERYATGGYEPFQLPASLQFVYLDLDQDELTRVMAGTAVEAANRQRAAAFNPGVTAYSDAASYLRAQPESCRAWVPPADGEPEVAPLQIGAGQVPMVGRVALFASMVNGGPAVFQQPFNTAIGRINSSNAELQALGGVPGRKITVFVVFSLSGGTGCGTFYDVLHLLGDSLTEAKAKFDLYPLVLMPSAFENQLNARENRRSRLNAGPAVLDLFRLIDYQNGKRDDSKFTVDYPIARTTKSIRLNQGMLQTSVLFSGSAAMDLDDVRRSMVAFMVSMMSVQGSQVDGPAQSFASSFINSATARQATSSSGVGRQGVSAAITASLRAPVDEVADLIAGNLLTTAIGEWDGPKVGEDNRALIEAFLVGAGLQEMTIKTTLPTPEVDRSSKKASDITAALNGWSSALSAQIQQFEGQLNRRMADISNFDYLSGLRQLPSDVDVFRLSRVLNGNPEGANPLTQLGIVGVFNLWSTSPKSSYNDQPPVIEPLKDRFLRGIGWHSKEVSAMESTLTDWYQWRQTRAYATAWARYVGSWRSSLSNLQSFVERLVKSFADHRRAEPVSYARRCGELLMPRRGVTFHLPIAGPGQTFGQFISMLINRYSEFHSIVPAERAVVASMLGNTGWGSAIQAAHERGFEADACLRAVREQVAKEVKAAFRLTMPPRQLTAVWPPLAQQLFEMSQAGTSEAEASYAQLAQELSAVLPTGIEPSGRGVLKILVAYPGGPNASVEDLLRRHLNLPVANEADTRFEATTGDSLEVTMFRDLMGLADCPEVTELAEFWMSAKDEPQPGDFLPWRRRFPEEPGRSIAFDDDMIRLLHQFLNVLWDGRVVVEQGDNLVDATRLEILPMGHAGAAFTLDLRRYGNVGSLHSFVASYEREAMRSNLVKNEVLQAFVNHVPDDAQSGDGRGPSPMYVDFLSEIPARRALAEKNLADLPPQSKPFGQFVYDFWHSQLDRAMLHRFSSLTPFRNNHRDLAAWTGKCVLPELTVKS